ncbi:hypothetical protein HYH03_005431 [Edaphochlamys debaryana]|uniref:Guanylate cyclase domain-containing protein n=1 Tax=Edaphochlamys debaryana TaxID=47281 RepID=A0A835YD23_9CHLO|nr:hypothetical protein HYH03_005431 [Edaphochlamys debaryana]|eukprot:KAG2496610.1 hypothetical protein HYH03_005431 [Edaphochlamys debaryana]
MSAEAAAVANASGGPNAALAWPGGRMCYDTLPGSGSDGTDSVGLTTVCPRNGFLMLDVWVEAPVQAPTGGSPGSGGYDAWFRDSWAVCEAVAGIDCLSDAACLANLTAAGNASTGLGSGASTRSSGESDGGGSDLKIILPVVLIGSLALLALALLVAWLLHRRAAHAMLLWRRRSHPPPPGPETTLVATDIENSTLAWEALPADVMDAALDAHHAAVRRALRRHCGTEFATEDAFLLAFHDSLSAVRFCLEAQQALLAAPWPGPLLALPAHAPVWLARHPPASPAGGRHQGQQRAGSGPLSGAGSTVAPLSGAGSGGAGPQDAGAGGGGISDGSTGSGRGGGAEGAKASGPGQGAATGGGGAAAGAVAGPVLALVRGPSSLAGAWSGPNRAPQPLSRAPTGTSSVNRSGRVSISLIEQPPPPGAPTAAGPLLTAGDVSTTNSSPATPRTNARPLSPLAVEGRPTVTTPRGGRRGGMLALFDPRSHHHPPGPYSRQTSHSTGGISHAGTSGLRSAGASRRVREEEFVIMALGLAAAEEEGEEKALQEEAGTTGNAGGGGGGLGGLAAAVGCMPTTPGAAGGGPRLGGSGSAGGGGGGGGLARVSGGAVSGGSGGAGGWRSRLKAMASARFGSIRRLTAQQHQRPSVLLDEPFQRLGGGPGGSRTYREQLGDIWRPADPPPALTLTLAPQSSGEGGGGAGACDKTAALAPWPDALAAVEEGRGSMSPPPTLAGSPFKAAGTPFCSAAAAAAVTSAAAASASPEPSYPPPDFPALPPLVDLPPPALPLGTAPPPHPQPDPGAPGRTSSDSRPLLPLNPRRSLGSDFLTPGRNSRTRTASTRSSSTMTHARSPTGNVRSPRSRSTSGAPTSIGEAGPGSPRSPKAPEPAVCVFRGLRVRMGAVAGVGECDVSVNEATRKGQYGGRPLARAKALCDAAQEEGALAWRGQPLPAALFAASAPELAGRMALLGPVRGLSQVSCGALDAPVGCVAVVFMHAVGQQALAAWDQALAEAATGVYEGVVKGVLDAFGGYMVELRDGLCLAAFGSCHAAVAFALTAKDRLVYADWPEELLLHELCETVVLAPSGQAGSHYGLPLGTTSVGSHADLTAAAGPGGGGGGGGVAMGGGAEGGSILMRGMRVSPATGRIAYRGRVMNRAARISAKALSGCVMASEEVAGALRQGPPPAPAPAGQAQGPGPGLGPPPHVGPVAARPAGTFQLKGVGQMRLYLCSWQEGPSLHRRRSMAMGRVGSMASSAGLPVGAMEAAGSSAYGVAPPPPTPSTPVEKRSIAVQVEWVNGRLESGGGGAAGREQPPGGTQPAEDPRARHDAGEPCQALLAASTSSALEVGTDGKLRYKFRPKGVPAGAWPRYPWYVSTFQDPFERINVWSHGLPSLAFLILGILALAGAMPGGHPLGVYGFCAMMTHAASTATHVWPDDRVLEKVDHICISFLIIGVPLTAIMALRPSGPYLVLGIMAGLCVGAAFLKPLYRTLGFVACGTVLFIAYRWIVNWNLVGQVVLQLIGGWFFVRNDGHGRWLGLQDHHILHYCVTAACVLHVIYIEQAVRQRLSDEAQQAVS